jgi:hypothetical protein
MSILSFGELMDNFLISCVFISPNATDSPFDLIEPLEIENAHETANNCKKMTIEAKANFILIV